MPVYTYRDEDGEQVLLVMTVAEKETKDVDGVIAHDDGRALTRDIASDMRSQTAQAKQWSTGLVSHAMGVHPDQRQEMSATLAAQGVPTDFDKDGGAIIRSRGHRNKLMVAMGMKDNDAGYGDHSGS
jgi:hypothetical protein